MGDAPKSRSFRIGDLRRPEVRSHRKRAAEPEPPASVGFPAIEAWLERESIDEVIEAMRPRYAALEALSEKGTFREKAPAKKAMGAYERAADLFEYLFATKADLQAPKK
jgi:hypothetical protein